MVGTSNRMDPEMAIDIWICDGYLSGWWFDPS
jgi:hypothetical protein